MGYKEAISQLSKYVLCKSAQRTQRDDLEAASSRGPRGSLEMSLLLCCNLVNNPEAFGESMTAPSCRVDPSCLNDYRLFRSISHEFSESP